MTFIRELIGRASKREIALTKRLFSNISMHEDGTVEHADLRHVKEAVILTESPPCQAVYVAVDEHYGNKLSTELDRLAEHEARLMGEIARREKRLAEVRRSQRALNAGLAVLQDDIEAAAS